MTPSQIDHLAKVGYESAISRLDEGTLQWVREHNITWETESEGTREEWRAHVKAIIEAMDKCP